MQVLGPFVEAIVCALAKGEAVELLGVGRLEVDVRGPRVVRNPQTGESISIGVRRVLSFVPAGARNGS